MTGIKATIYARYSTDRQSESSIADQFRVCEEFAVQQGWVVVSRHADEGISGAAIGNRPAFNRMMEEAGAGAFEAILVVDLLRLSRSAGDLNKIIDRMEFRGVRVVGVSDGYDSSRRGHKMQAGVQGITGESFREMVRYRTHEALAGRAAQQHFAGGLAYGYRSVAAGNRRRLEVEPAEADTVRWIFARFTEGASLRQIVYDLNARHVPSPRGGTWAVSALFGSPAKGSGILNNELYIGRYIWNRARFLKDPDTGKRKRVARDRAEWVVQMIPALRIVDDATWSTVRARMAHKPRKTGRRPSYLLSGILRCGLCGGAYVVVYRNQYGCAAHKDRGPSVCRNGLRVHRVELERQILAAIKETLLSPAAIDTFRAELAREIKAAGRGDHAKALKDRLSRLQADVANLIDAIRAGTNSRALLAALAAAEEERDQVAAQVDALAAPMPVIIPGALDEYRAMVESLEFGSLGEPEATRADLAELLGEIPLVPVPGQQLVEARLEGAYTGLLRIATGGRMQTTVVAGARSQRCLRFKAKGFAVGNE